ncbi:MAG: site-2 protease family protein, partial [Bacteroidota bacterium]
GHAFMGRVFGMKSKIRMIMIGGLTEWTEMGEKPPTNLQYVLIALAGPVAGFMFGGVVVAVYAIFGTFPYLYFQNAEIAYWALIFINFVWGLANLVPMFPLDGGHVMFHLLKENKKLDATRITSLVSLVVAAGVAVWAVSQRDWWIVILLVWIVNINLQRLQFTRQDPAIEADVKEVNKLRNARDFRGAYERCLHVIRSAKVDAYRRWGYEMAAVLLYQIDDAEKVKAFAAEFPRYASYSAATKFVVMRAEKGDAEALKFLEGMVRLEPSQSMVTLYLQHLVRMGEYARVREEIVGHRSAKWFPEMANYVQLQMFHNGEYEAANSLGEDLLKIAPDPHFAYNVACGHARMGNKYATIAWLQKAADLGFRNAHHMARDQDLSLVWAEEDFQHLIAKMKMGTA